MTCILATTAASDPNNWAGIKLTVLGTWDFCAPGTYRCYTVLQMCATASGSVVHPGTFQLKRLLTWTLNYFFSHFFTDLVLSNTSEYPRIPRTPFQHCCIPLDFFPIGLNQFYHKCFILRFLFCFILGLVFGFTLDRYTFIHTVTSKDWLRDRIWKRRKGTGTSERLSPLL